MGIRSTARGIGGVLGLACLCLFILACGGGSSSTDGGSSTAATTKGEEGKAEPSREFLQPKNPNNKLVNFGQEASVEEREAVSGLVAQSLKARERAEFDVQCETLSEPAIAQIPGAKTRQQCAASLKKFAEPLKKSEDVRADMLSGPIAALRVKGKEGYALFHGSDGKDYAVQIEKEGGDWKVASLLTVEL